MDVRTFTVGPVQENCHIARRDGAREAIVIDPGEEADRLLEAIEALVLADIMRYVPWAGFGPYESYDADHTVAGGETLQLAGLDIDVLFTPGHSPGHVTYWVPDEQVAFSGDVLFAGSIGRTDLPGGDTATLMQTLAQLIETLPDETVVHPGHMQDTTIGRERATNPFLAQ